MKKQSLPENAIAIVGIACRYPGARNLEEFWDNLREGRESITFFSKEELDPTIPDDIKSRPNYVAAKGKLDDVDKFDAKFFGITPLEASIMDPQQRLLLELSWASLEDAGIVPGDGDNLVGIWVGTNWNRYYAKHVRGSAAELRYGEFNAQLANEFDFPASRIAYKLNLTGPAITLATACSTSLVAMGQAMQSLLNFECNAALAGGASVSVPLNAGYEYHEGEMLSRDGHCRPFDANSSGTTFNDGAAVVTLKRLEDAVEDGDEIYAVIRGVGINNDGSDKVSYTAPSVNGQISVLDSALANADVDPASISFIETHGTATPMGDPIEVAAIRSVYGANGTTSPCAIGSLKSNIGHAIHAAGLAGVIKAALSVRDGVIPPTVNFETANPALELDGTRFFVNNEAVDWPSSGLRRAAVSSFGVGGTNAHAIVEQPPTVETDSKRKVDGSAPPLLLVSAKDAETCMRQVGNLAEYARTDTESVSIEDIGCTLVNKRARFDSRIAVFAGDVESLAAIDEQSKHIVRGKAAQRKRLVWAFPGQGAQRPGMGAELVAHSDTYRSALDEVTHHLNQHLDVDINKLLQKLDADDGKISETKYAQPALFAVGYALARHYEAVGLKPDMLIGHSIGEFAAACLAGVFSLADAARVVCERGRLMQAQPRGSMLSVSATPESLAKYLDEDICVAVQNSPDACVLAGPSERLEQIADELRSDDLRVSMLKTSHAFHSSMMDGALEEFGKVVDSIRKNTPNIPIMSTCTGKILTDEEAQSTDYWVKQIRRPVQFSKAVEGLLSHLGNDGVALLELGPGRTLASLFSRQSGPEHFATASIGLTEEDANVASWLGLGALWCAGHYLPVKEWWDQSVGRPVKIPAYPFRRDTHWLEPVATTAHSAADLEEASEAESTEQDLQTQVTTVFTDLTGLELVASDASKPLSDLGLDSLLLTQVAVALQQTFGIVITIKDLSQDFDTIEKITSLVKRQAPDNAAKSAPADNPPKTRSGKAGIAIQSTLPRRARKRKFRGRHRRDSRPASVNSRSELGETRAEAIETFIRVHSEKTAGSKQHTASFRRAHADPRTASGFNPVWKEIVYPLVCTKSQGSEIWDIDGNRYIDMLSGFGPNLLGHAEPDINNAIRTQLDGGIEIGPQAHLAGETAKLVCELTGMDRASFMCTGSEAVQAALRCARTYTRRSRVVLFEGAYHGNFDEVLVRSANSPSTLRTVPSSPGIPSSSVEEIIVLPWNDEHSLAVLEEIGDSVAAVLVEPVQSRTPHIQPKAFLRSIRETTRRHGSLLIFDEVVTGFRCHPGGAQAYFDIEADLATYGKVAGGNMPIGIVAGREDIMNTFDGGAWEYGNDSGPDAGVTFFAGTFVRHPLAIAACRTMLQTLKEAGPELQADLGARTERFANAVNAVFRRYEAPFELAHFTSVMYLRNSDVSALGSLFWYALRHNGIFALEGFPSYLTRAHTEAHLQEVLSAIEKSLEWMVQSQLLVEPRELNQDAGPGPAIPLEAPEVEARLGQDDAGNPGWFSMRDGKPVNVLSGQECQTDPWSRPIEKVFPASESQQEIWSATQLGDDASCAFNDSVSLSLPDNVDFEILQKAIDAIADRHEALRASVSPDGTLIKVATDSGIRLEITGEALDRVVEADVRTPFDLVGGPLFRFTVVKAQKDNPTLVVTSHHIVCDGWSIQLVLKELIHLYQTDIEVDKPALPAANRLSEYNKEASDLADTEAEDYWLDEFTTIPPVFDFPSDKPRPKTRSFESKLVELRVDSKKLARLKQLAKETNASLFNVLLAGWFAFTARLTGTNDLVIGIPTAGQVSSGMPNLVGHCVNLLPLRAEIDPQAPFSSLVSNIKSKLTDGLAHQDYTFGRLLKRLPIARDASRLPIVSIQFNLDPPVDPSDFKFGEAKASVTTNPRAFENFELFVNIAEDEDGLLVLLQYNSNLFDHDAMVNRLTEYFTLLDSACDSANEPTTQLDLLTREDRRLLEQHTLAPDTLDHDSHFLDLFAGQLKASPDKVAVVSDEKSLTYRELDIESSKRAAQLATLLPETSCALIGVAVPRSSDMLVTLLAIWKSGAAYVPLDPEFPKERLEFMISDSKLSALVSTSTTKLDADADIPTLLLDSPIDIEAPAAEHRRQSVDQRAYVIYTSGSTGKPKGVEIGHRAFSNFLQSMAVIPGLNEASRLVAVTTLSFDIAGLELFGPLIAGGTTIIASHEQTADGHLLRSLLKASDANVMQATPVTWRMLLESNWTCPQDFKVLCGGEAFPGDLATELVEQAGSVFNLYGPTESTVWSSAYRVEPKRWQEHVEATVPIGRPIHGTKIYVLDAQLNELPTGVPGELFIGGVGLAAGYLNRPELTEERFIQHDKLGRLYRTGDLVTLGHDGVMRFVQRIDSQVKVRGFRIELGEIESALLAYPSVLEAVATVYEPAPGDTRLAAYYVSDSGELDEAELRKVVQDKLPQYMVPQHFVSLEALPLTPNRKVDRKALPKPVSQNRLIVAPRNDTEKMVASVWQELLQLDQVSANDDFFNLGGHSILATRMISMLEARSGHRVPLRTLFANSVLSDFAGYVAAASIIGTANDDTEDKEEREVLEF